jgi:hypothetical protein
LVDQADVRWILGYSDAVDRYPELYALVMAFNMTLPMVVLMRFCGHGWRQRGEMIAAMFVPTIVLVLLANTGTIGIDSLFPLEDIATLACMLLIMIVRRAEYSSCPAGRHPNTWGDEKATSEPRLRTERKATMKQSKQVSAVARGAFRIHHGIYVACNVILWITWAIIALTSGSVPSLWPLWLTVGCGICLALHAHILYRVREADEPQTQPELATRSHVAL